MPVGPAWLRGRTRGHSRLRPGRHRPRAPSRARGHGRTPVRRPRPRRHRARARRRRRGRPPRLLHAISLRRARRFGRTGSSVRAWRLGPRHRQVPGRRPGRRRAASRGRLQQPARHPDRAHRVHGRALRQVGRQVARPRPDGLEGAATRNPRSSSRWDPHGARSVPLTPAGPCCMLVRPRDRDDHAPHGRRREPHVREENRRAPQQRRPTRRRA